MSDIMTCMPFGQLMDWVLQEKKGQDTVFGVHRPYTADAKNDMTIFTRNLETPVGPAATPYPAGSEYHCILLCRSAFLRTEDSSEDGRGRAFCMCK